MQSLLKRITDKAKEKGYGFRIDAYEMWNYGCEDYISDYHYSYDRLVEDLKGVECETIHFAKLDEVKTLEEQLKDNDLESVEDIDCSDLAFDILAGDYAIRWINYGGNTGTECLNDGSSSLWDILEIDQITEEYEEELEDFERF